MSLVRKIVDLLLYGNFYIALCAIAMLAQTELIVFGKLQWTYLTSFVFAATLCLYALHRIVGINKVKAFNEKYRYTIIERYRNHILVYALVGGGVAFYLFFSLTFQNQLLIILPIFLSLGYVVPFFGKQRRLRDFDYIKIFLVAIVWAFITVVLPIVEQSNLSITLPHFLLFLERCLFIFAITIPFDIRDLKVDKHIDVKTIPAKLGIARSKNLAVGCLFFAFILALLLVYLQIYSYNILLALSISYLTTTYFIFRSEQTENDYFFTGLMDGTMILQFGLVWLASAF